MEFITHFVGKPKELRKALKSLGLPSKITQVSQISLKDLEKNLFDEKTNKLLQEFLRWFSSEFS